MTKVRRALISVSDKRGIVEFAKGLRELGVEILSTGGTAKLVEEAGISVRSVSDYTGHPEMLDGRVKTLHPKVHGALLALRDNAEHMRQAKEQGIELIDMVVVNLYPFEETIARADVKLEEAIENIDIGGPTMLRSAAKNYESVAVVTDPDSYGDILNELRRSGGKLSAETRARLARKAFKHTAHYDSVISNYLTHTFESGKESLPPFLELRYEKRQDLRYGENPHQGGALYQQIGSTEMGLAGAEQLHGKELSFNNLLDLAAALEIARDFLHPAVVIIKHNNPCGVASGESLSQALDAAWVSDPVSAFGSVIGLNRTMDAESASHLTSNDYQRDVIIPRYRKESGNEDVTVLPAFVEAIIAPDYEPKALEILRLKKNLRVIKLSDFNPPTRRHDFDLRKIPGGALLQSLDLEHMPMEQFKVVTKRKPTGEEMRSMHFADCVAKHVKSNAIVLVQGEATVGIGAGQMSRVDSCIIAARKAGRRAKNSVLSSDAMFPARDGLDAAADTGASAVIQPGGSKRDEEVIAAADEHGLAMVFTGMRHFRH
ncbi:bifunctional phosphoribosylaminoimidazolecarboxamide formyltransferase/IMP cyclohydrolase [candidate division NPL-UPA2 bacterium]|nr:bifunctional phosphoribosylaminoimidazolecarboxamide formyltransferase/IMP cyclohydrolase [candidate division NPL-UPA2 bacterium]